MSTLHFLFHHLISGFYVHERTLDIKSILCLPALLVYTNAATVGTLAGSKACQLALFETTTLCFSPMLTSTLDNVLA